jgi:hypothetical protein
MLLMSVFSLDKKLRIDCKLASAAASLVLEPVKVATECSSLNQRVAVSDACTLSAFKMKH